MDNSTQSQNNASEYRFLAYLITALEHSKLKYFSKSKSDRLSMRDTYAQEYSWIDVEDVLQVDNPMLIGFQNELLTEALHQLTKREKYVIIASGLAGRGHIQIAKDLNITLGAERMLFSRTRKKVRTFMEERENELRSTHFGSEDG